ncbi:MAG TPA: S41 family peptidase [Bryobacteraceae bacterium]|nr:S41 family peptidase [Bryobacteraceae bacterium]
MTLPAARSLRVIAARLVLLVAAASFALALTPEQRQLNIESFEQVWKTVRDKHWQSKPAGLDWQAVHDEFRPAIDKADSMEAARAVMNDMLGRLHETHFGIVPAELYSDLDGESKTRDNTTGIDVRVTGSQALVSSVDAGSPAAKNGVQPGWRIVRIGGAELAPVIAKLDESYSKSSLRDIMLRRAILTRLDGDASESIKVDFLNGRNQAVTKNLARTKPRGTLTQLGYLYPTYVWFESARVGGGNVGYVRFNIFLDPARLMNQFAEAINSCMKCDGFIIDLRGNPGGLGAMAMGMAGWFMDKPDQLLGTLYMRDTTLKFVINPRAKTFRGPLAILVDGASASTSEILAEGLKDLGRARVFGTHTAAAALPSMFEKLPNGDGFQYAVANYISEGGKPLEGLGVTPDVETPLTRQALLEGKDPALDAAVAWIQKK